MVKFLKENSTILIIILILALYLGVKAFDPDNWDGWGFGSAQTLMSDKYWVNDGFIKNYFLFIPSSYSKLVKYIDEPEWLLRPKDNAGGALIRQRIYYTHYPPGYLIPYALLAQLGLESPFPFRLFSLIISLTALFLFYRFIKLIADKRVALVAAIYYGLSFTFLSFAYSTSTQPLTILFMFLTLLLSVKTAQSHEYPDVYKKYPPPFVFNKGWGVATWLSFFALSLSSYDATFFVFAWLIGLDAIVLKKFFWKKWLIFALVPIGAFVLQVFQNTWYLGWQAMLKDIYRSYSGRALGSPKNFWIALVTPFVSMTGIKSFWIFKKTIITLVIALTAIGSLWKLEERLEIRLGYFRFFFILALAAIAQPFFINVTGLWPYQGVLSAPFWGFVIGLGSISVFDVLKRKRELLCVEKIYFIILIIVLAVLWSVQFYNTWTSLKDWPYKPEAEVIRFSEEIKKLHPDQERFAFRILPENPIWKSQFPTFNMEYYMGMLTSDLTNSDDLIADFWWLRNRSEYPFYSFIISENKSDIEKIRRRLTAKNVKNISPVMNIQSQYLFTVGQK